MPKSLKKTKKKNFFLLGIIIFALAFISLLGFVIYQSQSKTSLAPTPKYQTPKESSTSPVELLEIPLRLQKSYKEWLEIANQLEMGLCEGNIPDEQLDYEPGIQQYPTKKGTITITLCGVYAYQNAYMAIYSDAQENHAVLSFRQFINPSETFGNKIPLGLVYNPEKQIFTIFSKGRGAGDCGAFGKYQLNEETRSVQVIEYRMKECENIIDISSKPDSWPLIFPQ